jgi:hypothetical protein
MKREEPAETGSPTLIRSLSALEDDLEGEALATIGKEWKEQGFDPWARNLFPQEENQTPEACLPSALVVPLRVSSRGSSSRGTSSRGFGRVHPSTPAVNRFIRSHGRKPSKLSAVEIALWATRLAAAEGLIELPDVPACELRPGTHPTVAHVDSGFRLLVACKWNRYPGSPVVFARTFAACWSEVTEDEARTAIDVLRESGAIVWTGECDGRARLWLPGRAQ